jgi:hypothetical protein
MEDTPPQIQHPITPSIAIELSILSLSPAEGERVGERGPFAPSGGTGKMHKRKAPSQKSGVIQALIFANILSDLIRNGV